MKFHTKKFNRISEALHEYQATVDATIAEYNRNIETAKIYNTETQAAMTERARSVAMNTMETGREKARQAINPALRDNLLLSPYEQFVPPDSRAESDVVQQ